MNVNGGGARIGTCRAACQNEKKPTPLGVGRLTNRFKMRRVLFSFHFQLVVHLGDA
jgi:hypothetical protein